MLLRQILFFFGALALVGGVKAQSFYERIMEQNIALADTCNEWVTLESGAYAMQRVSRGVSANWPAAYYSALCFVRSTDLLLLKKDTLMARSRLTMASGLIRIVDTIKSNDPECKILLLYQKLNELRLAKPDKKQITLVGSQLESFKKSNASNPRINVLQAYYYKCFFSASKSKLKKAIELLEQCDVLFEQEKPNGYEPRWGKKWKGELLIDLNKLNAQQ